MLFYVIRHGETDYNREARLQGARDIPLNDHGREQARANGRRLALEPGFDPRSFDWYASPLSRARETMELVRKAAGLEPSDYRIEPALIELSFGDWEGSTLDEIAAHSPEMAAAREADKWNFLHPGKRGESYRLLAARTAGFIGTVTRPSVLVAHGGTVRSILTLLAGMDGEDAVQQTIPQDRILKVENGKADWLPRLEIS